MNNITFDIYNDIQHYFKTNGIDVLNKKSITGISELSILLKKIQNAQQ